MCREYKRDGFGVKLTFGKYLGRHASEFVGQRVQQVLYGG